MFILFNLYNIVFIFKFIFLFIFKFKLFILFNFIYIFEKVNLFVYSIIDIELNRAIFGINAFDFFKHTFPWYCWINFLIQIIYIFILIYKFTLTCQFLSWSFVFFCFINFLLIYIIIIFILLILWFSTIFIFFTYL